ncbi:MAG: hypothetical protein N2688_12860 [Burkholderiaceae bacterium]|nr:hypothetical protein [Burkholderiaceae bacterium]
MSAPAAHRSPTRSRPLLPQEVLEDAPCVVYLPGENPRFELAQLAPRGFTVEDHELTLYGHCPE